MLVLNVPLEVLDGHELALAGALDSLYGAGAGMFIIFVALVIGVFRFRRKAPDASRPFRAWGFPFTGVICAVGWIADAVFVAVMDLRSSAYALILTAISIQVFLWLKSRRGL